MSCCCLAYLIPAAIAIYLAYKYLFKKNKAPKILEKNFKKDVVYLYQFPRAKTLPSVSPYCLKTETFLRVNKISYENRFLVMGRSKYGLLPFIELNGEHVADSQMIYEKLVKHFNIKSLPAEQEALSRAVSRMADGHSFYVFYKFKILDQLDNFVSQLLDDIGAPVSLKFVTLPIGKLMFRQTATKRIYGSLGHFSDAEFEALLRKDLDTFRSVLGNKRFLFGDSMSIADYSVFGILATGFYQPFENKISQVMKKEYPTLIDYCERIRKLAFEKDFTL